MNTYIVTFENGYVRDISGSDEADAQAFAEKCGAVRSIVQKTASDFDKGFGIGGLGRYVEPPFVPTIAQMERQDRAEASATYCRRCGDSELTGAMFTTDPGSGYCDDCYG